MGHCPDVIGGTPAAANQWLKGCTITIESGPIGTGFGLRLDELGMASTQQIPERGTSNTFLMYPVFLPYL
jgi:hypothetical protein